MLKMVGTMVGRTAGILATRITSSTTKTSGTLIIPITSSNTMSSKRGITAGTMRGTTEREATMAGTTKAW